MIQRLVLRMLANHSCRSKPNCLSFFVRAYELTYTTKPNQVEKPELQEKTSLLNALAILSFTLPSRKQYDIRSLDPVAQ